MTSSGMPEHVLHTLSQEYKTTLAQVKRLEHTLKQQQFMVLHKSIPKMYQPKVLTPVNPITPLTEDFNKEYRTLFFKHLERVMTNNNIALEIKRARLTNILSQIDHYLSSCGETPNNIAKLYDNFITENQIIREVPDELKKVLPRAYTSPPLTFKNEASTSNPPTQGSASKKQSTTHNRKRKNAKKHPKATKTSKQDHFLSLSLCAPPQPP